MPKELPKRLRKGYDPYAKPRHRINECQRKTLRIQARENPSWKQEELAIWFFSKFGYKPSQSTISESLSNTFTYLDDRDWTRSQIALKRQTNPSYPDLEEALFEVHQ